MRLVFMGTPPLAVVSLERLLDAGHEIAAVVTRADKPRGRGLEPQPSAVKAAALARGLGVLTPRTAKGPELADRLRELEPELGVVVAYGRILPPTVLSLPPLGFLNVHASLLPKLRGAAPIERAILEGLEETGVTIMRMNERLDEGDIVLQRPVAIEPHMNAGELREQVAAVGADLLVEAVDLLARGEATFTRQNHAQATYAPPLDKAEARIDWNASSESIDRRVRAFAPSPGAFTMAGGRRLKILAGRPLDENLQAPAGTVTAVRDGGIAVACGRGAYLVETVQPESKRAMGALDWIHGAGASYLGHKLGSDG